jgi:beta-galactosidase
LLENEPGRSPSVDTRSVAAFRDWLSKQHRTIEVLNRSWGTAYESFAEIEPKTQPDWNPNGYIDWLIFWRDYEAGQLAWLAQQVHAHDKAHPLHVNPHALVSNLAGLSDDLPSWRAFLDSMGCSIHPSWHFGLLHRDRYALGVSYVNDLIKGSIEPKPHWVTELQGGNNIHSAFYPMNPTSDDIAQWVWTSVGAGADRIIFWLLNARRHGSEAAEWSLLDFQQQPSARLKTASAIAQTIEQHGDFFDRARPVESPISLILSIETMTLEDTYPRKDHPGRDRNAHILEALGVYEALSQLGVPPRVKHFHDYNWRARAERPRTAVLPDVRAITLEQVADLEAFVDNGNTLLITGLTGFYDPYMSAWPLTGYPLSRVTGADLKEVNFIGDAFSVPLTSPNVTLPSHLWISAVEPHSAEAVGQRNGEVIATRRGAGKGSVIWIPSPIGLGAWLNDTQPLAGYLWQALAPAIQAQPFKFSHPQRGCLMRVLQNGSSYLTVVTNGGDQNNTCEVQYPQGLRPSTVWGQDADISGSNAVFHLSARKTSVATWR